LQKLFALMIKSHKKYLDPTDVLKAVVNDAGILLKEKSYLRIMNRKESISRRATRYHRISFEYLGKS